MKLYIAAPWVHRLQARHTADWFAARGYTITSRWLREHEASDDPTVLQREALADVKDVRTCDAFILLNTTRSDGKATELGMAYILGKPIVVVGERPGNVFHYLPEVQFANMLDDVLSLLPLS